MATRMQQRRGTAAQWASANPVLADGEVGYEKDTGVVKIGNGVSTWNQLTPILGSQYLPILGKAYDSERLDGLDSTAFAQKNYVDGLILPTGASRTLVNHFGNVTAFPTVATNGVKNGDRCYRTDVSCEMVMVSADVWRQVTPARLTKTQRLAIDVIADATPVNTALHSGFFVYETDTDRTWEWTGTKWRYLSGGATPFIKVRRNTSATTQSAGWNVIGWDGTVHADTTDTTMLPSANSAKLTAPIDGLYLFSWAGLLYSASASIVAYAAARKNGAGDIFRGNSVLVGANSTYGEVLFQGTFRLAAGEYIEAMTYGVVTVAAQTEFGSRAEMLWVGNY